MKTRLFNILRISFMLCIICYAAFSNIAYIEAQYKENIVTLDMADSLSRIVYSSPESSFALLHYIRENTPSDSTFLSFRRSDFMAYAKRNFIVNNDPRLKDFYRLSDVRIATQYLHDLKIEYLFIAPNPQPTVYNSCISKIIGDPSLSLLEYESGGYRLFKLRPAPIKQQLTPILTDASPAQQQWALSIGNDYHDVDDNHDKILTIPSAKGKERRDLYNGEGPLSLSPQFALNQEQLIYPDRYYQFKALIKGSGQCGVHLAEYDVKGKMVRFSRMWTGYLSDTSFNQINGVARTSEAATEYRLVFIFPDKGQALVKNVSLYLVGNPTVFELNQKSAEAEITTIYENDFNDVNNEELADVGWSTSSANRPVSWPSGIRRLNNQESVIFLDQPDNQFYWLSTGLGNVTEPASHSFDNSWQTAHKGTGRYSLSCRVKGFGRVVLYAIWYDSKARITYDQLGVYLLPEEFKELHKSFTLPPEAKEFRIAFYQSGTLQPQASLMVDDFKVGLLTADLAPHVADPEMITIYSNNFNDVRFEELADTGWSTSSADQPIPRPSEIRRLNSQEGVIFLEQPNNQYYWLYTGQGKITDPASRYSDDSWISAHTGIGRYSLSCRVQGNGSVVLYAIWYDNEGKVTYNQLGLYHLQSEFNELHKSFELPPEAKEYRIAFYLSGSLQQQAGLQVDDFKVELRASDKAVIY
jgi:hypothetical protein